MKIKGITTQMQKSNCSYCGFGQTRLEILESGIHYAKEVCAKCGAYIKFVGKPDNLKPHRHKSHTELVEQYSKGFCEICGILHNSVPNNEALEAHHVIEYQDGGPKERENIEIVCTACHKLIHWLRTYRRHVA